MKNDNPLKGYFRQVKTYISLPSSKFEHQHLSAYSDFSNTRKEVGVRAMTGVDELALKNPDALLNGEAIVQVISSCIPEIKDPKKIYINDMNVALAAIKLASVGKHHVMTGTCPACKHQNNFELDLESLIQSTTLLEESYPVKIMDLQVFVKPYTFDGQLRAMALGFEESQTFKIVTGEADLPETQKIKALANAFKKLGSLKQDLIFDSVYKVRLPNGDEIVDGKHIVEFLKNAEFSHLKMLQDKIDEINKIGIDDTLDATCESCQHTWKLPVEVNPTNFFTDI